MPHILSLKRFFFFRQITKRSMTRRWRATTSAATKISTCSTVRKLRKWRARYASVLNGRRLRFFSVSKLFKNRRVASLKLRCVVLQQSYKAEYEDIKTRCFFPQTITPEYEAGKKLQGCSDVSSTSLLLLCVFVCVHLVSDCWTYPKNVSFLLVFFCRKPTGSIQTRWNSHKWRIPRSWFKLPSTPNNSVTYVLHDPPCSIILYICRICRLAIPLVANYCSGLNSHRYADPPLKCAQSSTSANCRSVGTMETGEPSLSSINSTEHSLGPE